MGLVFTWRAIVTQAWLHKASFACNTRDTKPVALMGERTAFAQPCYEFDQFDVLTTKQKKLTGEVSEHDLPPLEVYMRETELHGMKNAELWPSQKDKPKRT